MTAMARHINDMKQRHEHAVRTQEIQSMLYGWDGADLTTLGDLILEVKISSVHRLRLFHAVFRLADDGSICNFCFLQRGQSNHKPVQG